MQLKYMTKKSTWTANYCNAGTTVYDKNFVKRKFSPISPVDVNGENFFVEYFPNPTGPLSCELSSPAIAAANAAVNNFMSRGEGAKKRGSYVKLDEEMKIKIGKYSSENGVSAAARRFSAELGRDINPSTIHGFKRAYLQELNRKRRAEEDDLTVTSLPAKGGPGPHPLLLGEGYVRGWRN